MRSGTPALNSRSIPRPIPNTGALKTNFILRWDWQEGGNGSNGNKTKLLWANVSLGGFTVGKTDPQDNQFAGNAGGVMNDDVIYDGPYELNQLTYNYDAGNASRPSRR